MITALLILIGVIAGVAGVVFVAGLLWNLLVLIFKFFLNIFFPVLFLFIIFCLMKCAGCC